MALYLTINTQRIPAGRGPKIGRVTFFLTKDGKPACFPWKLDSGYGVRVPQVLASILHAFGLINYAQEEKHIQDA